nr:hypothetical protein [Allomuricauda sp.]
MRIPKNSFLVPFFYVSCIISTWAQSNQKTYEAPNSNFKDIVLQTHKGSLRFGNIDADPNGLKEYTANYSSYLALVQFKREQQRSGWDAPYKTIDTNLPYYGSTTATANIPMDVIKFNAILTSIATEVVSEKGGRTYYKERYAGSIWKGNTVEQVKNYRAFVKENFNALKNWPKQIMKDGSEQAYYVTIDNVSEYDFENQGFVLLMGFDNIKDDNRRLSTFLKPIGNRRKKVQMKAFATQNRLSVGANNRFEYSSRNSYERNVDADHQLVFFPIAIEKANEVLKSGKIYIVRKIKLKDNFTFHVDSPLIELYTDRGLTKKIGQMDYNDLILYQ